MLGGELMKNRVCTTISAKHWELLKKHSEKFLTQQKVLEAALERLENGSEQNPLLSSEQKFWMRIAMDIKPNLCIIHKDLLKELIKATGFERIGNIEHSMGLTEYQVIAYCQKPLKECSSKEIMEGIVNTFRIINIMDAINYVDCGNYYSLNVIHTLSMGSMDASMSFKSSFERLFKTYGVKTESTISENSLFMKIYKNQNER